MASTTTTALSISSSSSSSLVDAKSPRQLCAPSLLTLPAIPRLPLQSAQSLKFKSTTYCRKIVRNVAAMATGDAPLEVSESFELPDIVKTVQNAWDKVEDKYAVSSLAVAGVVGLWASAGMVSAVDQLPLVPGVLELVGIGYSGWFAYRNLVFKPDREALIKKIKDIYKDVIGSSST